MADPRTVDLMLWCLCADAAAGKIHPSTVCEGAREIESADHARLIAIAAYQASKPEVYAPDMYTELTRVLFLWGELGDARHYLLPKLRDRLKSRVVGAKPLVQDRGFADVKAHLSEQYRFGADLHYRRRKEEMAEVLRDWLNENPDPEEWDEVDLATKLATVWGRERDPQP
jgi:hypothetical protein